jgi:WD40 repeat protein
MFLIILGSTDKTLIIWNYSTGTPLYTLTGHTKPIRDCCWSLKSDLIVSSSQDKTLRVINYSILELNIN